ncbi:hypothetical protein D3C84_1026750 [compost metagenome]
MSSNNIRICSSNLEQFQHPKDDWVSRGIAVKVVACLSYCGDCTECPIVELNGDILMEDSMKEMLAQIQIRLSS